MTSAMSTRTASSSSSNADEAEIIAFCRERLAAYKYPREVTLVPSLPKGPSGKVVKRELVNELR